MDMNYSPYYAYHLEMRIEYWREIKIIIRNRSPKRIYLKILGIWTSWFAVMFIMTIITTLIITSYNKTQQTNDYHHKNETVENKLRYVSVFLHKEKKIEKLPIEDYVKSVVMSEMPLEFETEALKAQAIII